MEGGRRIGKFKDRPLTCRFEEGAEVPASRDGLAGLAGDDSLSGRGVSVGEPMGCKESGRVPAAISRV